ncbi:transposase [Legionella fallonii]|uniref:Transposase n=1 Tax=Legionella fallonii LLAP-10 TaxID=1212491 RepID=A0A098G0Z0_9GAMM|nr:transposase [Legionella fallonii LLAP-10]
MLKQHADFIVPGHNQRRYDFRKGLRLGKKDHIVMWPKPRKPVGMSQRDYANYPNHIQIREFKVGGTVYITTLLEEKKYPKKELASLYQRRWEAEIHLNSIKTIMGMNQLACKSPDMVKKEIGFYFLAYTIIRYIMVSAAAQHDLPPNKISFKGALQLINELMPYLSTCSSKRKWLYHFITSFYASL